jgi:type IV pilus biogenesis protein CpaD/CtpE
MNNQKKIVALAGLLSTALLAACARPTALERSFGSSVRNMIEAQTFDPSTLSSPSTETVDASDGRRIEAVLDVYRTDVAKPAAASEDIVISVDGGN